MAPISLLLLLASAVTLGAVAAWMALSRRTHTQRAELEHVRTELRTQQSSQAQVMHTTKLASLGQMVAGVAHEINTPLGFVKSNVEVVNDLLDEHEALLKKIMGALEVMFGPDPAMAERAREALSRARGALAKETALKDARELLGDCVEGINTIANLVHNLKGFARVDRDGMDLIDLNESVKSALVVAAHQLRDRVQVRTDLGALPKVRCMPSQLNQVFLNLITNAGQAITGNGTLSIASRATANAVEVSFTDSGSGIPDEVLPKIFDPFFTTKAVGEGTGLGLSIVHKIIKAHGGAIHVKTAVGRGTTFTVSLPVETKQAAPLPSGRAAA
jgi:signal transduction histidine kinase